MQPMDKQNNYEGLALPRMISVKIVIELIKDYCDYDISGAEHGRLNSQLEDFYIINTINKIFNNDAAMDQMV